MELDTDDQNPQLENQLLNENDYNMNHNDDDNTTHVDREAMVVFMGLTQPTPPRLRAYTHT